MLQRRRNLVTRPDGVLVNVARMRGMLFVCESGCCCGRTDDGFAPVPAALYHAEWERRRFRNIVHLSIGGCLGPCALANVALLLFDGRALWFQSINSESLIIALYDYIEAMLDADAYLPPPVPLADLHFTASQWQDRPDGLPLDDHRDWRRRLAVQSAACPMPAARPGDDRNAGAEPPERALARWQDAAALPRKNGELVFDAPWHGRVFGMAAALEERHVYTWDEFRERLIDRIAEAERGQDPFDYYACWLAAFEDILAEKGMALDPEISERTNEYEFGERDEIF